MRAYRVVVQRVVGGAVVLDETAAPLETSDPSELRTQCQEALVSNPEAVAAFVVCLGRSSFSGETTEDE